VTRENAGGGSERGGRRNLSAKEGGERPGRGETGIASPKLEASCQRHPAALHKREDNSSVEAN